MSLLLYQELLVHILTGESRVVDHCAKQIMPYLLNKMFSAKSTQYKSLKAYKKPYDASILAYEQGM